MAADVGRLDAFATGLPDVRGQRVDYAVPISVQHPVEGLGDLDNSWRLRDLQDYDGRTSNLHVRDSRGVPKFCASFKHLPLVARVSRIQGLDVMVPLSVFPKEPEAPQADKGRGEAAVSIGDGDLVEEEEGMNTFTPLSSVLRRLQALEDCKRLGMHFRGVGAPPASCFLRVLALPWEGGVPHSLKVDGEVDRATLSCGDQGPHQVIEALCVNIG